MNADRTGLIADLVSRERHLARAEAFAHTTRIQSEFSAKGIGVSTGVLLALMENGLAAVNRVCQARIEAEFEAPIPFTVSEEEWAKVFRAGVEETIDLEMTWLENYVRPHATAVFPPQFWLAVQNRIQQIRGDRMEFFGREVRIAVSQRNLSRVSGWPPRAEDPTSVDAAQLTQDVFSRNQFDSDLAHLTAEATESNPLAMLLVDIDHFKDFNDLHGHATGDRVLRRVATTLRKEVGGRGRVYRHGGEEFAVLLPNHGIEEAKAIADRIRGAVELARPEPEVGATVSVGVSAYPQPAGSAELLSSQADAAMYRSKKSGRNRVTVFGTD